MLAHITGSALYKTQLPFSKAIHKALVLESVNMSRSLLFLPIPSFDLHSKKSDPNFTYTIDLSKIQPSFIDFFDDLKGKACS